MTLANMLRQKLNEAPAAEQRDEAAAPRPEATPKRFQIEELEDRIPLSRYKGTCGDPNPWGFTEGF